MDWKQIGKSLVADTPFGPYEITAVKSETTTEFGIKLTSGEDVLMDGRYPTISKATEAAQADLAHRSHMWETL